jgi:hypothetical protein
VVGSLACDPKGSPSKFSPNGLIAHLRDMSKPKVGDTGQAMWHWLVLEYLELLYCDFWSKGLKHKAFYPPQHRDYHAALAAETKEQDRYVLC